MTCFPPVGSRWFLLAVVLLGPAWARAADAETRDYRVSVDGKPAGNARMVIQSNDDGTVVAQCSTDIRVTVVGLFRAYNYTYRGRETWQAGRLLSLESQCADDGKRFAVTAAADGAGLRVRVNGQERKARGDVWLTSYWRQPDAARVGQVVPLLDADSGRDLDGLLEYAGEQPMNVAGQAQAVRHYRLRGKVNVELWYDRSGRLVRQTWKEDRHRVLLELTGASRQAVPAGRAP
jgi:hypothetical protein